MIGSIVEIQPLHLQPDSLPAVRALRIPEYLFLLPGSSFSEQHLLLQSDQIHMLSSRSPDGSKVILTWPYCPCPPDCFLYLYSTSAFLRIVSRKATFGCSNVISTLYFSARFAYDHIQLLISHRIQTETDGSH